MNRIGVLSVIMILVLGFGFWMNSRPETVTTVQSLFSRISPALQTQYSAPSSMKNGTTSSTPIESSIPWTTRFENNVKQMQGLTDEPELVDQQISTLAQSLSSEELSKVKQIVFDRSKSGDERLLAAELLSRSANPVAIPLLKEIASASAKKFSKTEMIQQEFRAIQVLAIEGIGNKPDNQALAQTTLQDLIKKTEDPLLADRIHRTLWALQGKAPSPEKQDEQALQKVLNK